MLEQRKTQTESKKRCDCGKIFLNRAAIFLIIDFLWYLKRSETDKACGAIEVVQLGRLVEGNVIGINK